MHTSTTCLIEHALPITPIRSALVAASLGFLSACGSLTQVGGPDLIPVSVADRTLLTNAAQDGAANKKFLDAGTDETKRRAARDEYVINRLALLDIGFISYIRTLSSDKRTLDSATEASQLTLGMLATVVDSSKAKENLAALVTAITGLKSNIDKNFYANKGTDVLVATMVSRRKEMLVGIIRSMETDTASYSLLSARSDLNEYQMAGSLDGAFIVIQADAAKRDATAQSQLKSQQVVRNVLGTLPALVLTDKRALTRSLDPAVVTTESATKALTSLGVTKTDIPASHEATVELLQDFVRGARTPEQIAALVTAFTDAGIALKR